MSKIIDFNKNREGYNYFAKAVLDSLCRDESEDVLIQIESISMDRCFAIIGATLDPETHTVNLQIR